MSSERDQADRVARRHLEVVAAGDTAALDANVTADYINHRAADEPLACRQPGPAGLRATSAWLARAFSDLRFEIHRVIVEGDRVAVDCTLHGRQRGPFTVHDAADGRVTDVFPSNGRRFAARQTHLVRIAGGRVAEHDAVRDDLGMARQLGWIPPSPRYVARMVWWRWRERRRAAGAPGGSGVPGTGPRRARRTRSGTVSPS